MTEPKTKYRCAIYTRKSTEEGLEQEFNTLDAQRQACEAYIMSQAGEGWEAIPTLYDDGGWSGGNMERPAVKKLLQDVAHGRVDIIVVYKVDRLTRSLMDFARMVETFDKHEVSFVSVTQAFNTTNSMGRLTLNVLLSFAQFEREVTGERIRDKIAAFKLWGAKLAHLDDVVLDLAAQLTPPVHDTSAQRHTLSDNLNKVHIESLDNAALGKLIGNLGIVCNGTRQLKRLQALLESIADGDQIYALMTPFYYAL